MVAGLDAADEAGPTTTDACTPLTNAADVAGKIALVDRGTCGFLVKAANVQAAGGIAMIVADNVAGSPPGDLTGTDPNITIPAVRVTQADGQTIRAALDQGVEATLFLDLSLRAGADAEGRPMIYTPDPVIAGSSVAHWDTSAFRNLLMEPNISSDLDHGVDLTLPVFRDLGWYPDADLDLVSDDGADQCLGSDLRETVNIQSCDSLAENDFFETGPHTGCTIADLLGRCVASSRNHGQYVQCVQKTINPLKKSGVITEAEAILSCAGSATLP